MHAFVKHKNAPHKAHEHDKGGADTDSNGESSCFDSINCSDAAAMNEKRNKPWQLVDENFLYAGNEIALVPLAYSPWHPKKTTHNALW